MASDEEDDDEFIERQLTEGKLSLSSKLSLRGSILEQVVAAEFGSGSPPAPAVPQQVHQVLVRPRFGFLRPRQRIGEETRSRRGCLCHAPPPHLEDAVFSPSGDGPSILPLLPGSPSAAAAASLPSAPPDVLLVRPIDDSAASTSSTGFDIEKSASSTAGRRAAQPRPRKVGGKLKMSWCTLQARLAEALEEGGRDGGARREVEPNPPRRMAAGKRPLTPPGPGKRALTPPGAALRQGRSKRNVAEGAVRSFLTRPSKEKKTPVLDAVPWRDAEEDPDESATGGSDPQSASAGPEPAMRGRISSKSLPTLAEMVRLNNLSALAGPRTADSRRASVILPSEQEPSKPVSTGGSVAISGISRHRGSILKSAPLIPQDMEDANFPKPQATFRCQTTGHRLSVNGPQTLDVVAEDSPALAERRLSVSSAKRKQKPRFTEIVRHQSLRSPVADRLKRLEVRYKRRLDVINKRERFKVLPPEEQTQITEVFRHLDTEKQGYLQLNSVVAACKELGMGGLSRKEKRDVASVCEAAFDDIVFQGDPRAFLNDPLPGVNLFDLALIVLPKVRASLSEGQTDLTLRKLFYNLDTSGEGLLTLAQSMELAREMGLDRRIFRTELEIHCASRQDGLRRKSMGAASVDNGHRASRVPRRGSLGSSNPNARKESVLTKKEEFLPIEVELEEFQAMATRVRWQMERLVRERERQIKDSTGIKDDLFEEFRSDIVNMFDAFTRHDTDEDQLLSATDIMQFLKTFGNLPQNDEERLALDQIFERKAEDISDGFSFNEVLTLIRDIRSYRRDIHSKSLRQSFEKYDKDKNGTLSAEEISALLTDVGCTPRNRRQQDELAQLMRSADVDGNGYIGFKGFQFLWQRIDEKLRSMRYEEEVEYAVARGFTEEQLRDFRWVFDSLDVDGSNTLDAAEVRTVLRLMEKPVSQEDFEEAFHSLDADGSGCLDFKEFIDFMQLVRDSEGIFAADHHMVPTHVRFIDTKMLRKVAENCHLSKLYIGTLDKEELIYHFCEHFGISPEDDLHEVLGVVTETELYERARMIDQAPSRARRTIVN